MKKTLLYLPILLLLFSCKSQISFQSDQLSSTFEAREVPYELGLHKKKEGRLMVLLKDNIDSIPLKESPLLNYFIERHYHILIPAKPGDTEYEIQQLDRKEARINDVYELVQSMDSLRRADLIIVGMGEGGYLAPELGRLLAANATVVINAGPFSPLQELEIWSQSDTILMDAVMVMKEMEIDSKKDLREKLQQIKEDPEGAQVFPLQSNAYHLSYYRRPVSHLLNNMPYPVYWIISAEAPMVTVSSQGVLNALTASYSHLHYALIPGKGAFSVEKEMDALLRQLDYFLMKRQSY